MRLSQRILITALAFWIGVLLMPLTPFLFAWLFWGEEEEDVRSQWLWENVADEQRAYARELFFERRERLAR